MTQIAAANLAFMLLTPLVAAAAEGSPPDPFHPLEIGLRWTYRTVELTPGNRPIHGTEVRSICGVLDLPDGRCFLTRVDPGGGQQPYTLGWTRLGPDGLSAQEIRWDAPSGLPLPAGPASLLYKFPAQAGDRYVVDRAEDGSPLTRCEVAAVKETVRVDEKEYECVVYDSHDVQNGTRASRTYVAAGLGIVKFVYYHARTGEPQFLSELVRFGRADGDR